MGAVRDWTLPEVALVTAGLLLLLWQPVFFLNDEHVQALGHRALADGHLETESVPPGYDPFLEGADVHPIIAQLDGGAVWMPGSDMENAVGLPVRGVLLLLSLPLGLGAALGLVAGTGVGSATWTVLRRRLEGRRAAWAGVAVGGVLLLGSLARPDAFPRQPWLDVASLQLAIVAWTAVAAALWFDLLRRDGGPGLAWAGTALWLLGTPLAFWALNIKYHGLALALTTMALWAYRDGHRSPPLRTFLAASLVGLAVWNHLSSGGLLGAALGLAALPGLRAGVRFLPRVGAGLGGLALGLVPEGLWHVLRARKPPAAVTGAPPETPTPAVTEATRSGTLLDGAVWNDPVGVLDTLGQTFAWADWMDLGPALAFLAWAPWLLLGLVTLARRDLRAHVPLWPVAVLYAVVPLLLLGRSMLDSGDGFDPRHHVTAWPWLVLLAWPAVAERLRGRPRGWWLGQAGAAAAVGMSALLVTNLLWHKATGLDLVQMGHAFEGTWMHRYAGATLAAALAAWLAVGRWVRTRWPGATDRQVLDPLLAWSLAASTTLGVWLRLAAARSPRPYDAPFVAWPVDLLAEALRWVAYSH